MNTTWDTSIFETPYKETPVVFKDDPLVLSYIIKTFVEKGEYVSMEDSRLLDFITPEVRNEVEVIRKYYTKKWFWTSFTDSRMLSDFRSRVCFLLETRNQTCSERDCGIYYKLPWFYDEDMIYDEFKKKYKTEELPHMFYGAKAPKSTYELEYLKSTICTQRKRKIERFWFTDQKYLFNIEVEQDNPLIEMFREFITPGKTVKFDSYITHSRIDKMNYYKLFKFNFTKE